MDLHGRWWNGVWHKRARRDIWLYEHQGRWIVRARIGSSDIAEPVEWPPWDHEHEARAWVQRLMDSTPVPTWRELTHLYRRNG